MNNIKNFEKKWRKGIKEDWDMGKAHDEYDRGFKDGADWILDLIEEEFALHENDGEKN